jgi:hypothetical protein
MTTATTIIMITKVSADVRIISAIKVTVFTIVAISKETYLYQIPQFLVTYIQIIHHNRQLAHYPALNSITALSPK